MGFGVKRPGDGVAPLFFEGDFGLIFQHGGGTRNSDVVAPTSYPPPAYVGPQIGMNPKLILGLPDLEY